MFQTDARGAPLSGPQLDMSEVCLSDPFHTTPSSLQRPSPCAQTWHISPQKRDSHIVDRRHDSVLPSSYQASFSSTASSSMMSPISSIDLEKAAAQGDWRRESVIKANDPEKAVMDDINRNSRQTPKSRPSPAASEIVRVMYREEEDREMTSQDMQEANAMRILLFLSGPCVFLSILNTIWAVISVVLTIFTQPVRICARRPSFSTQLSGLLGPALNLQLRAIYTPLQPHANEDGSYHGGWLCLVHLLSPFVSFCIMFLSWIVAAYWASSAIVGDPAGLDKRDDGRESVLGVRKWWESFLLKAVKSDICADS